MYWSKGGVFFLGFDKDGRGDSSGDPEVDSLISKLRIEFDTDKQKALAQDIQRSLAKSMYTVMSPGSSTAVLMAWPALRNFVSETWVWGYSGSDYFDIYNWWVDDTKPPIARA
jgi:ABC-type transport system substrate-binding protein